MVLEPPKALPVVTLPAKSTVLNDPTGQIIHFQFRDENGLLRLNWKVPMTMRANPPKSWRGRRGEVRTRMVDRYGKAGRWSSWSPVQI